MNSNWLPKASRGGSRTHRGVFKKQSQGFWYAPDPAVTSWRDSVSLTLKLQPPPDIDGRSDHAQFDADRLDQHSFLRNVIDRVMKFGVEIKLDLYQLLCNLEGHGHRSKTNQSWSPDQIDTADRLDQIHISWNLIDRIIPKRSWSEVKGWSMLIDQNSNLTKIHISENEKPGLCGQVINYYTLG